jgi:hypothetical protein
VFVIEERSEEDEWKLLNKARLFITRNFLGRRWKLSFVDAISFVQCIFKYVIRILIAANRFTYWANSTSP